MGSKGFQRLSNDFPMTFQRLSNDFPTGSKEFQRLSNDFPIPKQVVLVLFASTFVIFLGSLQCRKKILRLCDGIVEATPNFLASLQLLCESEGAESSGAAEVHA